MLNYRQIGINHIKKARESAEGFDALAFAVCIKLKFSSSCLHKSDVRNLKKLFSIWSEKAGKIIQNALEYGYIKEYGSFYVVPKLKDTFNNGTLSIETENITLKNVRKELIKLTICNHIHINEKVQSLKQKASNPKTLKEYKTAKKLTKKWNVTKFNTDGGLSYSAIAKKANVSVKTAIKYINELVSANIIKKQTFKIEFFNPVFIKSDKNIFEHRNILFFQQSNRYTLAF